MTPELDSVPDDGSDMTVHSFLGRPLTIVSVLPGLLNTNGDAANARVLAQRTRWAGHDARIIEVNTVADLPDVVDVVVIGSGSDSELAATRDVLRTLVTQLRTWVTHGVPILAVGTGWELLSWGVQKADGTEVEGLGLIAGRAVARSVRVTDDLVVSSRFGRLVGFENHARDYTGAEASPLGRVLVGSGNGNGAEGLMMGDLVGTHLHGPVLARNPRLADHLLSLAFARNHAAYVPGGPATSVDVLAAAARNQVAARLSLDSEDAVVSKDR